jgi:hypothetical protein
VQSHLRAIKLQFEWFSDLEEKRKSLRYYFFTIMVSSVGFQLSCVLKVVAAPWACQFFFHRITITKWYAECFKHV